MNDTKIKNILSIIKSNKEQIYNMLDNINNIRRHNTILKKLIDDYCSHEWKIDNGCHSAYSDRIRYCTKCGISK